MAKNPIPVRQDPKDIRGSGQTGLISIGEEAASLPVIPTLNPGAVALQVKQLNEQANRVLAGAERANITDEQSASVGTDFLKAISVRITEVDDARKGVTGSFDKLVKGLNALFTTGPTATLNKAKTIMQSKLGDWARSERERLEREARAASERAAAEAAAQAQAAIEDGDTEGALEILESASNVDFTPEKPVVRGATAALTGVRRKVGRIINLRQFLAWAGTSDAPMALAVVGGIDVGQKELNQLAAAVIKANEARVAAGEPSLQIPGFSADYAESFGAR